MKRRVRYVTKNFVFFHNSFFSKRRRPLWPPPTSRGASEIIFEVVEVEADILPNPKMYSLGGFGGSTASERPWKSTENSIMDAIFVDKITGKKFKIRYLPVFFLLYRHLNRSVHT